MPRFTPARSVTWRIDSARTPVAVKRFIVAKGAAADAFAAVAVGAGEAGVERDLVHPLAVPLQHGPAKGVDAVGKRAHAAEFTDSASANPGFTPVSR